MSLTYLKWIDTGAIGETSFHLSSLDVQAMAVLGRILMILKNRVRIVLAASHSFPFLDNLFNHVWNLLDGAVMDHSNKREVRSLLDHPFQSRSGSSEEIDIPWIL